MRLTLKENSMDEFKGILKLEGIYAYRNYYDYYYQFWSVMLGLSYLLNGIEAFVDRHLQEFNVSPEDVYKRQLLSSIKLIRIPSKFEFRLIKHCLFLDKKTPFRSTHFLK